MSLFASGLHFLIGVYTRIVVYLGFYHDVNVSILCLQNLVPWWNTLNLQLFLVCCQFIVAFTSHKVSIAALVLTLFMLKYFYKIS